MTDTWEPRPLPEVDSDSRSFWAGAADERLLIGACQECDRTFFYPRRTCPHCLGDASHREASGEGEIYSYSVSHQVANWPDEDLPLITALVELDEGPRVFTNIVDAEPTGVAIGTPVAVEFVPTEREDIAIPVFSPR